MLNLQFFILSVLSGMFVRYNFFYPTAVISIISIILGLFWFQVKEVKLPKVVIGGICFLLVIPFIYASSTSLYASFHGYEKIFIALSLVALIFTFYSFKKITPRWLCIIYISLFLIAGVFTIKTSPLPNTDVHALISRSSDLLLKGVSPYFKLNSVLVDDYFLKDNMFAYHEDSFNGQNYFNVSPHVVFVSTLGKLFFGDVRYGFLFFLCLSVFLVSKITDEKKFKILSFCFLLMSNFLIEQSWDEPVIIFLFLLIVYLKKNNRNQWMAFVMGLMSLAKLYMLPLAAFFMISEYYTNRIKFKKQTGFFTLGLLLPFVVASFWGMESIIHLLIKDIWHFQEVDSLLSNSISNWVDRVLGIKLYVLSSIAIIFPFSWFTFKEQDKGTLSALRYFALSIICFFLFSKTFFYNHAWITISMLMVLASLEFKRPSIDIGDLGYFCSRFYILIFMPIILSDIWHYSMISTKMLEGKFPYIDFVFEYPPFSIFHLFVPALIASKTKLMTVNAYRLFLMLFTWIFDFHLYKALRKQNYNKALFYAVGTFILGPFLFERLDLPMMWFMVMSVWALLSEREALATLLTVVGGWYKLVPFAGTLVLFKDSKNKKQFICLFVGINLFIATLAAFIFKEKFLDFINYHVNRPFQIEGLVPSVVFFVNKFVNVNAEVVNSFGSWNVLFTNWKEVMLVNKILLFALLLYVVWKFLVGKVGAKNFNFVLFVFLVPFASVFSTQYMLWIFIPFVVSDYFDVSAPWFKFSMILTMIISIIIFINYDYLLGGDTLFFSLLLVRNILLIVMAFLVFKKLIFSNTFRS